MKAVIVTWQGGGATQPAIGIGRLLAERGHQVRIVAPAAYADRVATAGCAHRPYPPELEFDPAKGRAAEDQEAYVDEILLGLGPPALLAEVLGEEPADVAVIDYLMRTTLCKAEQLEIPRVLLFHMIHRFHGVCHGGDEEWGWRWQYRQLNEVRKQFGLEALPIGPDPCGIALMRRAAAGLVAMPREFDPWPDDGPANVTHVGPIFEQAEVPPWESPWPADDDRPLVVLTMGSTYMHQEEVLTRIAGALGELDVRTLVLTGHELGPEELDLGADVAVRDFVPHASVLPHAALVITHAGVGTLMAAFAAGVPTLCLPLGRDQSENAERVAEIGAGAVVSADSSAEEIRDAVVSILGSDSARAAAEQMAAAVAGYETEALTVAGVERAASG